MLGIAGVQTLRFAYETLRRVAGSLAVSLWIFLLTLISGDTNAVVLGSEEKTS